MNENVYTDKLTSEKDRLRGFSFPTFSYQEFNEKVNIGINGENIIDFVAL